MWPNQPPPGHSPISPFAYITVPIAMRHLRPLQRLEIRDGIARNQGRMEGYATAMRDVQELRRMEAFAGLDQQRRDREEPRVRELKDDGPPRCERKMIIEKGESRRSSRSSRDQSRKSKKYDKTSGGTLATADAYEKYRQYKEKYKEYRNVLEEGVERDRKSREPPRSSRRSSYWGSDRSHSCYRPSKSSPRSSYRSSSDHSSHRRHEDRDGDLRRETHADSRSRRPHDGLRAPPSPQRNKDPSQDYGTVQAFVDSQSHQQREQPRQEMQQIRDRQPFFPEQTRRGDGGGLAGLIGREPRPEPMQERVVVEVRESRSRFDDPRPTPMRW